MFTYLMKFDDEESKSKFELLYLNYRASMFNIAKAILRDDDSCLVFFAPFLIIRPTTIGDQ